MNERWKRILRQREGGMSYKEIAAQEGVTDVRIQQIYVLARHASEITGTIKDHDLGARCRNCLVNAGLPLTTTRSELKAWLLVNGRDVLKVRNLGKKSLDAMKAWAGL